MSSNPMDFSFNLAGVDTAFPSLVAGSDPLVKLTGWEMKDAKDNQKMIRLLFETLEPATDTKGKTHQPGFKLSTNLTLPTGTAETPGEHDEIRLKNMASFQDALDKTDEKTRTAAFNGAYLNEAVGKKVRLVIKPAKDTTYGETDIRGFKPFIMEEAAPVGGAAPLV